MTRTPNQMVGSVLRNAFVATAASLAFIPAAFADGSNIGLQKFLASPTDFVALSAGAPGEVTFASMTNDTLLVRFSVPGHASDAFGEVVGTIADNGEFVGNKVLIDNNGEGHASPVTMNFNEDGTIVASINGGRQDSGFIPKEAYYGQ